MNIWKRVAILGAFGVVIAGARLLAVAEADTGDNLRQFDADVPACGVGTGIAFDGTHLYLSCWGSNVLERVNPADGSSNGPITIDGLSDLGAMAFDGSRSMIWACEGRDSVALIDPAAQTGEVKFSSNDCVDGLAYDGADDTIWLSPDAYINVYHYKTDGTLIETFNVSGKLGQYGNSGIAVGGEHLYLANNGGSQIYECTKDFEVCTLMSTFERRIEDLECDNVTFAPKAAIWSQDAYDRTLNAWEIPAGTCILGGGAEPEPTPSDKPKATATPCIPPLIGYRCDTKSSGGSQPQPTEAPAQSPTPVVSVLPATVVPQATPRTGVVVSAPDTGDGSGTGGGGSAIPALAAMAIAGAVVLAGGMTLARRRA